MRNAKRFCALVLALVMILPLISIPAFAQDQAPTFHNQGKLLWSNNFSNASAPSDVYSTHNIWAQIKDIGGEHGKVMYIDNKPAELYDKSAYWINMGGMKGIYWKVTDAVVAENGTVSGKVTLDNTEYTFSGATLNTDKYNATAMTVDGYEAPDNLYLITGSVYDALYGGDAVAKPNNVKLSDKNIKPGTTDASLVFAADYFFSSDFTGGMDVRLSTQAGNIEFANLVASGNNIAVKLHDNLKTKTEDEKEFNITIPKGTWATIAVVLNPASGMVRLYCNGDLAGKGTMTSGNFLGSITGGAGWNLGHVRRGGAVSAYNGYWMVDNLAIYSGDYGAWTSDAIYSRGFDGSSNSVVSYPSGTYAVNNAYNSENIGGHLYMNWTQGKADSSKNYPNGGNVNRNLFLTDVPEISYSNYDSVVFEADYYLPQDANYHMQMQFYFMTADWYGDDESMAASSYLGTGKLQWNQITQFHVNNGKISGVSAGNSFDGNPTAKVYSYNVPTGQWVTISTVLNLDTGWIQLWMQGSLVAEWQMNYSAIKNNAGGYAKNITIPAGTSGMIWAKLSDKRADAAYANGFSGDILMDNFKVYESEKPHVYVENFVPVNFNSDDFESYELGSKLDMYSSYNAKNPTSLIAYNKILADNDGNQFIRVPMVYDGTMGIEAAGFTNYDKTLTINNTAISYNDEFMVLDLSVRPHGNEAANTNTIELQIDRFTFDLKAEDGATMTPRNGALSYIESDVIGKAGWYLQLLAIDINTGVIKASHTINTIDPNPKRLTMDEWNDISYVLDLKRAQAIIYLNGEFYGTIDNMLITGTDWASCSNASNITIPACNVIASKINKTKDGYKTVQEADENYTNVNYLDIDNLSVSTKAGWELDGGFIPELYDGIISTTDKTSIRLSSPTGLRFAHLVNVEKLDELYAEVGNILRKVEFGTLIVPEDYLGEGVNPSVEALKAANKKYLEVKATYGKYYTVDQDAATTHFVGSIVNILDSNITRDFVGIGYVKVITMSGLEYYYYSETAMVDNVQGTAQRVIDTTGLSGYTVASQKALQAYSEGKGLADIIAADLNGLNVLAMGDSLFAGTDKGTAGCARENQWVNLLGRTNNWTLTNLGIGGMTVSQTSANVTTGKASMYEWLFEGVNDYKWNSSSTGNNAYQGHGHNSYFQCGDFEGKTAEDVDLIILEGGCNDYGYAIAAPLGTITSNDPSTFLGAWNCVVEELLKIYPNAKIVFITTWYLNPQSRPDGMSSIEYSTSINRLYDEVYADNDRVFIIDAGNPAVSGVDMRNIAWQKEYSNDAYHLKDNGMALMANAMLPRLWEIWVNATANEESAN